MPAKIKAFANVVEGPMGFHMPEATARAIEVASKGISKDFEYRRKAKSVSDFQFSAGERADVSLITTDDPDREDEVVITKGASWDGYDGVVTWCHTYEPTEGFNGMPIGSCLWRKQVKTENGNGWKAKTAYFTRPEDHQGEWLPDVIVHLQRQTPPACKGKSIGFIPFHAREATKSELAIRPEWDGKVLIDKWLAFEYAVTPVPCNPRAEVEAVAKGTIDVASKSLILRAMKGLGAKSIADIADEAMAEAASRVADMIPYYTADELRYALMSKLNAGFTEDDKLALQQSIIDTFDRASGAV